MKKNLTPAERLIVAADFKPTPGIGNTPRFWVRSKVLELTDRLENTGVYLKVNSASRACGYDLSDDIHKRGLKVFLDLKFFDIPETLSTDGVLLREAKPELLTVVCSAGIAAMRALKEELPDTEILGVTVLTSQNDADCLKMYSCITDVAVNRLAEWALKSGIGGVISSAKEAEAVRRIIGPNMTINTPAIRPTWAIVPADDQNPERIMTPAKAIKAGADRIVVGRPITKAKDPYDAVMRTIEEIASAIE